MNDLQNALIKAKLASEKQVPKSFPVIQKQRKQQSEPSVPSQVLSEQFVEFESLYNNEKSKQFAVHLLHSFLPFPDNDYIWGWEDKEKWKNGKKCCICELETLSRNDLLNKENLSKQSKVFFEGIKREVVEDNFDRVKFYEEEKQKLFGDKVMGVTSERTSCILCAVCYELFQNWIHTKMLRDHSFCKLITHIRKSSMSRQTPPESI